MEIIDFEARSTAIDGLVVLTITFACFAFGWIGGGDAKLAAATALWLGFDHLLVYLVYAAFAGCALAMVLLSFRRWPLPAALITQQWAQRLHDSKSGMPYGVALAIGALLIYPDTVWMKAVDFSRLAIG